MNKLIIFILVFSATAFGQAEVLTNQNIVEMTDAGLSAEVVMKKIRTSSSKFDVSASALIALKKADVPDEIIALMMERQDVLPAASKPDGTPAFAAAGISPNALASPSSVMLTKKESLATARTISFAKSSIHPSRQAIEKELLKRKDFQSLNLTIERYKDTADLYVEIGYVSMSWLTHRYVYRIYDRRSGAVLAAGETTSWGSLAENLARHISKSLLSLKQS